FNSVEAVERSRDGRTNPMVNSGAIATTSLAPDWEFIHAGLSRFAGGEVGFDEEVYASASATNARNQALARLLDLDRDPGEAVDLYTRQCSLRVSARDLAVMGATLADGGGTPVSGARGVD